MAPHHQRRQALDACPRRGEGGFDRELGRCSRDRHAPARLRQSFGQRPVSIHFCFASLFLRLFCHHAHYVLLTQAAQAPLHPKSSLRLEEGRVCPSCLTCTGAISDLASVTQGKDQGGGWCCQADRIVLYFAAVFYLSTTFSHAYDMTLQGILCNSCCTIYDFHGVP